MSSKALEELTSKGSMKLAQMDAREQNRHLLRNDELKLDWEIVQSSAWVDRFL